MSIFAPGKGGRWQKRCLLSMVTGLAAVLPFVLMEVVNRRPFQEDFPFVVFGILWGLLTLFSALVFSIAQAVRGSGRYEVGSFLLRLVWAGMFLLIWLTIVYDQMPCFLGIPNCD